MATLQGAWLWYELLTTDAGGAKAFYEGVVGWSMSTGHADNANYGFITNADGAMGGGVLTITADMAAHGARPVWVGYIGVDDVDATLVMVAARGGKVLMPATDIAMAGRVAMVLDPEGAPFYLMTPTPQPGGGHSTAFSPSLPGRCGWNELCAADPARALGFYTGLFGWDLPAPMDMGEHGQYQFFAQDGVTHGGMMRLMPHMTNPHWNHYFRVADIDAAKTAVLAHGGLVHAGPMPVPTGDWVLMGSDPQGAAFCLLGKKRTA